MTDKREILPQRRPALTFEFDHITGSGATFTFRGSVGLYEDGRPGEVFLNSTKINTDTDAAARDSAVLVSFALQHGATLAELRAGVVRGERGEPLTVIGTFLDCVSEHVGVRGDAGEPVR